jgi:hypothetical protein
MVLQVKAEVDACKVKEKSEQTPHDWATPYRTWVKDRASELMRRISN